MTNVLWQKYYGKSINGKSIMANETEPFTLQYRTNIFCTQEQVDCRGQSYFHFFQSEGKITVKLNIIS